MKEISLRLIRKEHNSEIAAVIRKTLEEFGANKPGTVYFDPATDDLFSLFQIPRAVYFVAELDGRIVGGSGVFPTQGLPEDCCELVKLYLLPEVRGMGFGKQLMNICFEKAMEFGFKRIYLESMPELRNALGLYAKAGFSNLPGPMGQSGHSGCDIWMIKNL